MKKSILFLLFFVSITVFSQHTVSTVPRPNQHDARNFVSNPNGILAPQTVAQLNQIINSLRAETQAEMAVVALNSIGYEDIFDFSERLFQLWEIGAARADNGLLILFVLDQQQVRFEVGYGLEGVLPDAVCMQIIQQAMIPHFRAGNYDAGMLAGVERTARIILENPVFVPEREPIDWSSAIPGALAIYLLLVLVSLFWISSSANAVKKNPKLQNNLARYNALKVQKMTVVGVMAFFIPFLAIFAVVFFFGVMEYILFVAPMPLMAIPANIYGKKQLQKIRQQPIPCKACDGTMHILSDKEANKYLNDKQQLEKQLGAMDYDVFLCDKCKKTVVLALDKPSAYSKCPKCKTKAFGKIGKRRLVAPTYTSEGIDQTTFKCKFCGYEEHKNTQIPRLQRVNNAALVGGLVAGSMMRGAGGRGGGFGGGGSFGGGRSGGGGAVGRW